MLRVADDERHASAENLAMSLDEQRAVRPVRDEAFDLLQRRAQRDHLAAGRLMSDACRPERPVCDVSPTHDRCCGPSDLGAHGLLSGWSAASVARPGSNGFSRRARSSVAGPNDVLEQPRCERGLVERAAGGDPRARERLIDVFWPRIAAVARIYDRLPSVNRAELMQEGVAGLLIGLRCYDPSREVPFWGYAAWWVRQAMQRLVAEVTGPVVLSDRATRYLVRVRRARQQHLQATGQEPSTAQLAQLTRLDRQQIDQLISVERAPRGLDEPLTTDDASSAKLSDCIADPHAEDPYERVLDRLGIDDAASLPDGLRARERHVIRSRYGIGRPVQTLQELAEELHITAERVRQIQERALDQLRSNLAARQQPPALHLR
jgi:RNA polymerase primary sigma factor